MRSAQYALREAARDLRFCVQLHIGPHTVKAFVKTLEAIDETQGFFQMLEEEEEEDEE
jgi:hypothetical protein